LARDVSAYAVTDSDTRHTMRRVAERHGYLVDPHTAVALAALERLRGGGEAGGGGSGGGPEAGSSARPAGPAVVLATAHPGKFPDVVHEVTGVAPPAPPGMADLAEGPEGAEGTEHGRPERFDVIPPRLDALAALLNEGEPLSGDP
jgi:threonine synthase